MLFDMQNIIKDFRIEDIQNIGKDFRSTDIQNILKHICCDDIYYIIKDDMLITILSCFVLSRDGVWRGDADKAVSRETPSPLTLADPLAFSFGYAASATLSKPSE